VASSFKVHMVMRRCHVLTPLGALFSCRFVLAR